MWKKIGEWFDWKRALVANWVSGKWAAVEAWLNAHVQGFKGFVIGFLVAGVIAARVACQVGK